MTRASLPRMLARGAVRRCPRCSGRGAFFTGWFAKADSCRTCGLRWRRGDVGFELGAAAMAAIITVGPLVVMLGIVFAITWPTVDTTVALSVFLPAALLLPFVTYPLSYTMWQAIDLMMRPVESSHFDLDVVVGRDAFAESGPADDDPQADDPPARNV